MQRCRQTGATLQDMIVSSHEPTERRHHEPLTRLLMDDLSRRFQHTSDSLKQMLQRSQHQPTPSMALTSRRSAQADIVCAWTARREKDDLVLDDASDSSRGSTAPLSTARAGTSCSDYESLASSRPSSATGVRECRRHEVLCAATLPTAARRLGWMNHR